MMTPSRHIDGGPLTLEAPSIDLGRSRSEISSFLHLHPVAVLPLRMRWHVVLIEPIDEAEPSSRARPARAHVGRWTGSCVFPGSRSNAYVQFMEIAPPAARDCRAPKGLCQMRRLLILLLLVAVGPTGCFWGERGPGRYEGRSRGDEHRGYREGEHREGEHREGDHGRDNQHHEGR